jgi:hypothetical protein
MLKIDASKPAFGDLQAVPSVWATANAVGGGRCGVFATAVA